MDNTLNDPGGPNLTTKALRLGRAEQKQSQQAGSTGWALPRADGLCPGLMA